LVTVVVTALARDLGGSSLRGSLPAGTRIMMTFTRVAMEPARREGAT